jgi:hypothetical protein
MTGAVLLPFGVRKEIRALLPVWLACGAAIVAGAGFDTPDAISVAVIAYVLGSVALGAWSIGHEYTGRTLSVLLTLPRGRRQLYLLKFSVLIPMLLSLGALAFGLLFRPRTLDLRLAATIPLLSVLCGLFVAPWLTMICRSPLAGVVFALATPGMIYLAGDVAAFSAYGLGPEASGFRLAVLWWGLTGLSAVAAVASWRMFMRLEVTERRHPQMRLPRWLRRPAAAAEPPDVERARHPVWLLAKKELRLQHMTFAVSGIYLLAWGALALGRQIAPLFEDSFVVLSIIHGGVVALMSGSLASAEEREFGTLESQALLPMATSKQWTVKAGTALSLTLLLGAGLPVLLGNLDPSADSLRVNGWFAGILAIFTAASLYVSSLCASGLRALLVSVSVMVAVPLLLQFPSAFAIYWIMRHLHSALTGGQIAWFRSMTVPFALVLGAGLLGLLLRFALVNHRSSERRVKHAWRQVACLTAWLTLAVILIL